MEAHGLNPYAVEVMREVGTLDELRALPRVLARTVTPRSDGTDAVRACSWPLLGIEHAFSIQPFDLF